MSDVSAWARLASWGDQSRRNVHLAGLFPAQVTTAEAQDWWRECVDSTAWSDLAIAESMLRATEQQNPDWQATIPGDVRRLVLAQKAMTDFAAKWFEALLVRRRAADEGATIGEADK